MNEKLLSTYMGTDMFQSIPKTQEFTKNNLKTGHNSSPLDILNSSDVPWSCEILSETVSEEIQGRGIFTSVALYLPGVVRHGVGFSQVKNRKSDLDARHEAYMDALASALATFGIVKAKNYEEPSKTGTTNTDQTHPVSTTQVPSSTTEKKPDNIEAPMLTLGQIPHDRTLLNNGKYYVDQIERINKFKSDMNLSSEAELNVYLRAWNKSITNKSMLDIKSIDQFLHWIETGEGTV